jgi:hypothetical protein
MAGELKIDPTVAAETGYLQKLLVTYERSKDAGPQAGQDAKHVIAVWLDAIVEGEGTVEEKVKFLKLHLQSGKAAASK